jgi:hypothetical protein
VTAFDANLFLAAAARRQGHAVAPLNCLGVMKSGDNAPPHVEMRKIGRFA